MKHRIYWAFLPFFLFTIGCETVEKQPETICLPMSISITLVQGSQTSKIIADFNYLPGTEQLDHITWSNHQTHYFEYDELDRLRTLIITDVEAKVQEEKWFVYEGVNVVRVDLVKRNLDYTRLEPLDSVYTGYVEFGYEGANIVEEYEYEISADGFSEEYVRHVSYTYDIRGNLTFMVELDPVSGEARETTLTYDQNKHPFYDLEYYFHGETCVNNMLSRTDGDFNYTYETLLNEYTYPETVYEKLGSAYSRIINYSYEIL
jgi:hypothetical protein